MAAVPAAKFEGLLGEWRERVRDESERVTTTLLREGERAQRDEKLSKAPTIWPAGKFGLIYADPPWRRAQPGGQPAHAAEAAARMLRLGRANAP